jgi:hypothetical protein
MPVLSVFWPVLAPELSTAPIVWKLFPEATFAAAPALLTHGVTICALRWSALPVPGTGCCLKGHHQFQNLADDLHPLLLFQHCPSLFTTRSHCRRVARAQGTSQ